MKRFHRFCWKLLAWPIYLVLKRKFNYSYLDYDYGKIKGPVVVVPNHACAWDPFMIYVAFKNKPLSYVASEHIMRMPKLRAVINTFVGVIPIKKGYRNTAAVADVLKALRAGESVFIAAEGQQTWNGISGKCLPTIGKIIKASGATLITYRIEGAYLTLPRWAKDVRKNNEQKIHGSHVNIYSPETLESMTAEEVNQAIEKDIYFNVWDWQKKQASGPARFGLNNLASGIEKALYLCPECKEIGGLLGTGNEVVCRCGFRVRYMETGFFDPAVPFETIAEWDTWQKETLKAPLSFSDTGASLTRIGKNHTEPEKIVGDLSMEVGEGVMQAGEVQADLKPGEVQGVMRIGSASFDCREISRMDMTLSDRILFSAGGEYYEIKTEGVNLRKYVAAWELLL